MENKAEDAKDADILDMAKFVVAYFVNCNEKISQLKLQKLLYYIQAWHLVYFDKALLFPDKPQAWVNGPVYRRVYGAYAAEKDKPINPRLDASITNEDYFQSISEGLTLTKNQKELINSVLLRYGKMSDMGLVHLTHTEKPWLEARKGLEPFKRSEEEISFDTMYAYYKEKLEGSAIKAS